MNSESANLLIKEITVSGMSVYFDGTGQIIIPSKIIEKARVKDDPKYIFTKIPKEQILDKMGFVFTSPNS